MRIELPDLTSIVFIWWVWSWSERFILLVVACRSLECFLTSVVIHVLKTWGILKVIPFLLNRHLLRFLLVVVHVMGIVFERRIVWSLLLTTVTFLEPSLLYFLVSFQSLFLRKHNLTRVHVAILFALSFLQVQIFLQKVLNKVDLCSGHSWIVVLEFVFDKENLFADVVLAMLVLVSVDGA